MTRYEPIASVALRVTVYALCAGSVFVLFLTIVMVAL